MKHTEGKLEVVVCGYGLRKLCQKDDIKHDDIFEDVLTKQAHFNLDEAARCWNAFNKGGLVDKLLDECKALIVFVIENADDYEEESVGSVERLQAIKSASQTIAEAEK